jgi:phage repressor protein C with HTH and peptisase S24 domain
VPLLGWAQAGAAGAFDEAGFPAGKGWDEAGLPAVSDEHAYALEISGDAMKPVYRDGDLIVVSPGTPIRRGDRVVVKTRAGEMMLRELKRRTAKSLELQSLNTNGPDRTLAAAEVQWIARIVWVSQ